jgi:2-oxoglutarate dehydrogenase E2 component (dihydrolipoamide succinyltransferase)
MAESITEGTLKQFSKAVGDYVKADEEVATIETDKVGKPAVPCLRSSLADSSDRRLGERSPER